MRRIGTPLFTLILATLSLVGSGAARADVVTDWNETVGLAIKTQSVALGAQGRPLAIMHAAVFDAVNGIERRYTPVHVDPAGPPSASRGAAAVQAAYTILVKLYGQGGLFTPNQQQTLDARLTASLAELAGRESAAAIDDGRTWGKTVAEAIWAWRLTDGFANVVAFPGVNAIGQWRQTPNDPYPGSSAAGIGYKQFSEMTPWSSRHPHNSAPPVRPR